MNKISNPVARPKLPVSGTTKSTDVNRIIKEVLNNFMPINSTTLDKMDKFPERQKSPKLIQQENNILNTIIP